MCEPGDSGLKLHGYELRAKLAMRRYSAAWIIGAGVLFYLGITLNRLNIWAFWLMAVALALLGLSAYFGGLVAEHTAYAFSVNNDWPSEGKVGRAAHMQKLFVCLAVLLVLAALVVSVYVRPGPIRPMYMGTQPSAQQRNQQTPMRPLNPQGGAQDVQPAPAPGGEAQRGRLERQPPRSQRDRGTQQQPEPPPPPPAGG